MVLWGEAEKDVPKAVEYAASFLAHFLGDKILPKTFVHSLHLLAGKGQLLLHPE